MKLTKKDAEKLGAILGEHYDDSMSRASHLSQAIVSLSCYGRPPVLDQSAALIDVNDSIPDTVIRGLKAIDEGGEGIDAEDWPALVEELEDLVAYLIEMRRFP